MPKVPEKQVQYLGNSVLYYHEFWNVRRLCGYENSVLYMSVKKDYLLLEKCPNTELFLVRI